MLNGEQLATKRVRDYVAHFQLEYRPGTLEAIALDENGRKIGSSRLASASGTLHLDVRPETTRAKAGGIAYVAVNVAGTNGEVEANADEAVTVEVEGGTLLGFGSARPATTESFLSGTYTTYHGRALAVVFRSEPGIVTITSRSATLGSASATVSFE